MSIKNKSLYNNGEISKYFSNDDIIPEGFVKGALPKFKEHLKTISNNRLGKTNSEQHREKISQKRKGKSTRKGIPQSEETKKKISDKLKGRESYNKGLKLTEEQKINRNKNIVEKHGSLEEFYRISNLKNKNTKLKKYGDPNYNNSKQTKLTIANKPNFYTERYNKTIKTKLEKYGSLENANYNFRKNLAKKYGFDSIEEYNQYWRTNILKNVNPKNSSLENRLETFLINNKFIYKNRYRITKNNSTHEFDFAIFQENKLVMLIDCDGLYYHEYLNDRNGKSINNYTDDYRFLLVPDKVKFIVITEDKNNEEIVYKEFLKLFDMSYDEYVNYIFKWCKEGFPYPHYTDKVLNNSLNSLLKSNSDKLIINQRLGNKIIEHFHPSIWKCHKKGKKSPFDAYNDDELLLKCIKNRFIYKGTNLDKNKILAGFSASGIAPKVSTFNPSLAKYLIKKYLSNCDKIFDPFSGFSGRLLGTISLGKYYIGRDINPVTINESMKIKDFFYLNCDLAVADITENNGEYEALFTCPPYSDKENWNQDIKKFTCDEWIDICLRNYNCKYYLFVVDETVKYKDYIVEKIENKSHLTNNVEKVIFIKKSL